VTREEWLLAAVEELRPLLAEVDCEVPEVRVSVGWPSSKATSRKHRTIGECWKRQTAADGVSQIFISPTLGGEEQVLGTLIHELIHAWDNGESGHKGNVSKSEGFKGKAVAVGLTGKMTATTVGTELMPKLTAIAEKIGDYPHSPISPTAKGKVQGTRMIKVQCFEEHDDEELNGYLLRTTAKWLNLGLPMCPEGHFMDLA
jgi:hypothetical protein